VTFGERAKATQDFREHLSLDPFVNKDNLGPVSNGELTKVAKADVEMLKLHPRLERETAKA
jgi:hypothetical protein